MTPEQFVYWLQGCAELNPDMPAPSAAQWQAIKEHLATVFVKVTPPVGGGTYPQMLIEAFHQANTAFKRGPETGAGVRIAGAGAAC